MPDRVLAEFGSEHTIARAIRDLHERGYRRLDAYLPFPSHVVEEALGRDGSRLPVAAFAAGLVGAGAAYFLQWYLVSHLYPLAVGGRPPHFPLAFFIITFEMGVLFAALTVFTGVLVRGRLVRLVDEVQGTPGFESATRDRFWLEVSMRDPAFDRARTWDDLVRAGALRIEVPEDPR